MHLHFPGRSTFPRQVSCLSGLGTPQAAAGEAARWAQSSGCGFKECPDPPAPGCHLRACCLSPHLSQAVPPLAMGLKTHCLAQLLPTRAGHSPDRRFPIRDLPGDVRAHESAVLAQRLLRGLQIQELQSPTPEPPPPLLSGLLYSKNRASCVASGKPRHCSPTFSQPGMQIFLTPTACAVGVLGLRHTSLASHQR